MIFRLQKHYEEAVMFLKLASIPVLFISAALGFFGLGHMSGQCKAIAELAAPRPLAVTLDAPRGIALSETPEGNTAQPNSRRAWVDPSGLEDLEQVARAAVADREQQIPAHRSQDHLGRELPAFEVPTLRHDTCAAIRLVETARLPNPDPPHKLATDPRMMPAPPHNNTSSFSSFTPSVRRC
jgi:hypothetical protein